MRIAITNDDGISAPGLLRLAAAVAGRGHDVLVAAPAQEASGTGASLTAFADKGRVLLEQRDLDDLPEVPAYAVRASPGYIALLLTIGAFGPPPDLVLSGINRGANAGRAVLHSGTVGAALTAVDRGGRAMAVSLDILSAVVSSSDRDAARDDAGDPLRYWDTAAEIAVDLIDVLAAAPSGTVLNLNVPNLPREQVRGLRRAALARFGQVQIALVENGGGYVRTSLEENGTPPRPGTDLAWLADGYASVTALDVLQEAAGVELDLPPLHPAGSTDRPSA